MTDAELKEAITSTFKTLNSAQGISIDNLYKYFENGVYNIDEKDFKRIIYELDEEQILTRESDPAIPHIYLYKLRDYEEEGGQQKLFETLKTKSDIEREERTDSELWTHDEFERTRESLSVLHDIASGHAQESEFIKYIRDYAIQFANENPVELLLELAEWTIHDLNSLAKKSREASKSNSNALRRLVRELGFRRSKVTRFFRRLLRFDPSVGNSPGILLPYRKCVLKRVK